jgi:hypothetical protein
MSVAEDIRCADSLGGRSMTEDKRGADSLGTSTSKQGRTRAWKTLASELTLVKDTFSVKDLLFLKSASLALEDSRLVLDDALVMLTKSGLATLPALDGGLLTLPAPDGALLTR